MRNRTCGTGNDDATEPNQRNCSLGFQAKCNISSPATFEKMAHIDKHQNAAGVCGTNRGQTFSQERNPLDIACNCGHCSMGQLREPFNDQDCQNVAGQRRCCSSVAGLSTSQPTSHQHVGCERRCCGSGPSLHRGRRPEADNAIDRMRSSLKSSVLSVPGDFQRNAPACGCMSHLPSVPKKGEMRTSSVDTTSNANFPSSSQTAPNSKKQINLYGWYLAKPKSGEYTTGCSSIPRVAVGGYRSQEMLLTDFVQTASIEQRLKRWKLRTSDGLEVTLMGMIDLRKSIGNGFSPELVQYFLIGFPPTWIYMMLSLSSGAWKGLMPDLPSPPAAASPPSVGLSEDRNHISRENQERPMEANPVVHTKMASLFTAPNQGTWTAALHRASTVTASAVHDGSPDANINAQCELDQEQSDRLRGFLGTNPPVEHSGLHPQTSSATRDCPHSGPEAIGVKDTGKDPKDSSQTRKSAMCWDWHPSRSDGDVVGDTGEGPESNIHSPKSTVVMDIPDLAADAVMGEDAGDIPESSSQTKNTQVIGDCPISVVNVEVTGEGFKDASIHKGKGVVDLEELAGKTDDFAGSHIDASALTSPQVPCTPLQQSRQPMQNDTQMNIVENSTREEPTDSLENLPRMDTGRKLRSGKHLPVNDKPFRGPTPNLEDTLRYTKIRKRLRSCHAASRDGDKGVVFPQGFSVMTEEVLLTHEDAAELDGSGQVPSTPLQTTRKRLHVHESIFVADEPTRQPEKDPPSVLQSLEERKTRSGRQYRVADKAIRGLPMDPLDTVQITKPRKRLIPRPRVPVVDALPSHISEVEVPPCNALVDENIDTEELPAEKGTTPDSEIVNKKADASGKESDRLRCPVTKKRQRRTKNYYKSRRKQPPHRSCPDIEQKQKFSDLSSSCDHAKESKVGKVSKVGSHKTYVTKEAIAKLRKKSTKKDQSSKRNCSKVLNCTTSSSSGGEGERIQTGKRGNQTWNSIVPPPLPAPRVADKSKVTEAFGLKKSRFGRVLVPPLAVWCNQSIKYDMDGSIIAISDGFRSEAESSTGCYNFKFPSDKDARTMQRKLHKAAGPERPGNKH